MIIKIFSRVILLSLTGLTCLPCANAANRGFADSGNLLPLPRQKAKLRLVREDVVIRFSSCQGGDYAVLASYEFHNLGKAQTIKMGLPENDYLSRSFSVGDAGLVGVRISIDDAPILIRRHLFHHFHVEHPGYNALWVASVPFRQGQTRHVQVRYSSCMWGSCGSVLAYSFSTNQWKGKTQQTKVILSGAGAASMGVYYSEVGFDGVAGEVILMKQGGKRTYHQWSKWKPHGTITIG